LKFAKKKEEEEEDFLLNFYMDEFLYGIKHHKSCLSIHGKQ